MDKVRLGRALGYGTRHAAKTLAAVAEAAAAPDPGPGDTRAPEVNTVRSNAPVPTASTSRSSGQRSGSRVAAVRETGRSFWGPLMTFSSALWLRVTGLFFAVIALAMANGAWRVHGALRGTNAPEEVRHFWTFCVFAMLFGYFAVSSFTRAAARERRAATRTSVRR